MAERKSGPVKPPTLDLTAKEASQTRTAKAKPAAAKRAGASAGTGPKSAQQTAKPKSTSKATPHQTQGKPAAPASRVQTLATAGGGALAGGVLGLVLAYGLALAGLWPVSQQSRQAATAIEDIQSLQSDLAGLGTEISTLATRLDALDQQTGAAAQQAATLEERVDTLAARQSVAPTELEPLTADIAALQTAMDTLSSRMDALSLETGPGDEEALAALTGLQATIDRLETAIATLDTTSQENRSEIATLKENLEALQAQLASQQEQAASITVPALAQLPLALSGFEAAIAHGLPYVSELAAITAALPDLTIPTSVAETSATGLPDPASLEQTLADAIPAMLAAKPVDPTMSWQDALVDRLKALIALRPAEPVTGTSPEAVLSRLEAALAERDFAAALTAFSALPAKMQTASTLAEADLSALAAAQDFARAARAAAYTANGDQAP